MKQFFVRAGTRIGRFFWSRGFLKFVLWTVTLVALLYVEEDWRGAHAWAATKAKWEARGETFDYAKFIPPPVPDDQNLAAIPLFALEPDDTSARQLSNATALRKALHQEGSTIEIPMAGGWQHGDAPDQAKIQTTIASDYVQVFNGQMPPADTLGQFDDVFPFISDLNVSATLRPQFRYELDYMMSPLAARPLGPVTQLIKLSQILTLHAVLNLDRQHSDVALADMKTNFILATGARNDPTLIGGLVSLALRAVGGAAIYHGLADHRWNDAQLAEIERLLAQQNCASDYQFAMRCVAAESGENLDFFKRATANDLRGLFLEQDSNFTSVFAYFPNGWIDLNKCKVSDFLMDELRVMDPKSGRVFPDVDMLLRNRVDMVRAKWGASAPWNIWFAIMAPPMGNVAIKFAESQVWNDESLIACALERYRLAKGVYPPTLDDLVPADIDAVPHDIINGEPYHYRLNVDGTFLLYSVGWNQTDDGGKVAHKQEAPAQIDCEQGDWVWPTPKR